jgi:hypothetical protein
VAADKTAVESKTLADGVVVVKGGRGVARLSRLGPGVLLYACEGVLSEAFYAPMVAMAQREVEAAGKLVMFVDGLALHSVDTGFREQWTEWFRSHKAHFHMHLLVRSKLMDMAASLANLFTGISVIKSYSSPGAWERACRTDFPAFRHTAKKTA